MGHFRFGGASCKKITELHTKVHLLHVTGSDKLYIIWCRTNATIYTKLRHNTSKNWLMCCVVDCVKCCVVICSSNRVLFRLFLVRINEFARKWRQNCPPFVNFLHYSLWNTTYFNLLKPQRCKLVASHGPRLSWLENAYSRPPCFGKRFWPIK